jgi:hypothetical protein
MMGPTMRIGPYRYVLYAFVGEQRGHGGRVMLYDLAGRVRGQLRFDDSAAGSAAQDVRASLEAERLATVAAMLAGKALIPSDVFEVLAARLIIRKQPLKLRQRRGERQVGVLQDVRRHGSPQAPYGQPLYPLIPLPCIFHGANGVRHAH